MSGLERIKIARARTTDIRPFALGLLAAVAAVMVLSIAAASVAGDQAVPFVFAASGVLLAAVVSVLVFLNLSGSVHIGSDGLLVDRRDDQRFVAFDEIEGVEGYEERVGGKIVVGVVLVLRGGERYVLPIGEHHLGGSERAEALRVRILQALEQDIERRNDDTPAHVHGLDRGERSATEWVRRLRGVGAGAHAGHRDAPVPPDELWRVVESPAATPCARASAAAALASGLTDEGKRRLRIAADETARPRLRVALTSAIDDDDDALVEALEELDREETRRARR